jgi:hypothetical protein
MMPLMGEELREQEEKFTKKLWEMEKPTLVSLLEIMFNREGYEDREVWLAKANDMMWAQDKMRKKIPKVI